MCIFDELLHEEMTDTDPTMPEETYSKIAAETADKSDDYLNGFADGVRDTSVQVMSEMIDPMDILLTAVVLHQFVIERQARNSATEEKAEV